MTFLFFAGLVFLIAGLSSMTWPTILIGAVMLAYAVTKLDNREQEQNRLRWEALRQEQVAKSNGKPHGNVEIVRSSDD